jgi:hypothetical protein
MKYFTPELLARFRSEDLDVSAAAHDDWEQAIQRYHRRLAKIQSAFPTPWQRFRNDRVCLHDAKVLSIGRQGETFLMVLQPESPSPNLVFLTFTLDGEPIIDPAALPAGPDPNYATWMYEEFDLDRLKKCTFEVLLSNGWSVKLAFRDFVFLTARRLFPDAADQKVSLPETAVTRSA